MTMNASKRWTCEEEPNDVFMIGTTWDESDFTLSFKMFEDGDGTGVLLNVENVISIRDHLTDMLEGL